MNFLYFEDALMIPHSFLSLGESRKRTHLNVQNLSQFHITTDWWVQDKHPTNYKSYPLCILLSTLQRVHSISMTWMQCFAQGPVLLIKCSYMVTGTTKNVLRQCCWMFCNFIVQEIGFLSLRNWAYLSFLNDLFIVI